MLHVLWREQQAPKDEEEIAEVKRVDAALVGEFAYLGGKPKVREEAWLPEGLPETPPSWW